MKRCIWIYLFFLCLLSSKGLSQTHAGAYGSFGGFLYHSDNGLSITELDNFLHDYGGGAYYQKHWKNTRSLRLNFEYDNSGKLVVGSLRQTDVDGSVLGENAIELRQQVIALDASTIMHYGDLAVGGGVAIANIIRTINTIALNDRLSSLALGPLVYTQAALPLNAERSVLIIPSAKMRYLFSFWHFARGRKVSGFWQHFVTATLQVSVQVQL